MMELESTDNRKMQAFNHMLVQKNKVAQTYNRRVKRKSYEVGDLVWKIILPIDYKDKELGKWSPNWERQVLPRNGYWLVRLRGEPHKMFINGKYLKKYFPTLWEIIETS